MNSQRFLWYQSRRAIAIIRGLAVLAIAGVAVAVILSLSLREKSPAQGLQPTVTHTAVMTTSAGDIELELYGKDAPKAVENFVGLAGKNFYNDILFHRIVPNLVIQAGDPGTKDPSRRADWGKGGESIYGTPFEDELNPMTPSFKRGYVEGTLAMANRGPNTNTSQFFIILKDNDKLPKTSTIAKIYTIFGKVTRGLDVVHKIESGGLTTPVKIVSIKVKKI